MSQKQLAAVLGVTQRTIGNWERDERHPRNRMGAIVEVLGLDVSDQQLAEADIRAIRGVSDEEKDAMIATLRKRRGHGAAEGRATGLTTESQV